MQTYLSEYDNEGAFGHVSLGRSFAVEVGSAIPITDQKLGKPLMFPNAMRITKPIRSN